MVRSYIVLSIILLFLSCNKDNTPRVYTLAKIQKPRLDVSEIQQFTWDTPDFWIEEEVGSNSLRLATYKILLDNKESSDLSITKFKGDAGGILLNVNRWRRQLDLPPESLEVIESTSLKGISKLGDFIIYKLINDELNKAFLCMILELPSETIFAKLSSTKSNINDLEQDFINFCSSFRLVKNEE